MFQLVLALLFIFFLPGFFVVNALFPRKGELDREYDAVYRITLGIVMSLVVVVLFGFGLNSLGVDPATGLGYFVAPNLWAGLLVLTAAFFGIGWWRGAYPSLGRLHPKLLRTPPPAPESILGDLERDKATIGRFRELAATREKLKRQIKDYERRMRYDSASAREHYARKLRDAKTALRRVDADLEALEKARGAELY